jgi:ribosomal protein S27AE
MPTNVVEISDEITKRLIKEGLINFEPFKTEEIKQKLSETIQDELLKHFEHICPCCGSIMTFLNSDFMYECDECGYGRRVERDD